MNAASFALSQLAVWGSSAKGLGCRTSSAFLLTGHSQQKQSCKWQRGFLGAALWFVSLCRYCWRLLLGFVPQFLHLYIHKLIALCNTFFLTHKSVPTPQCQRIKLLDNVCLDALSVEDWWQNLWPSQVDRVHWYHQSVSSEEPHVIAIAQISSSLLLVHRGKRRSTQHSALLTSLAEIQLFLQDPNSHWSLRAPVLSTPLQTVEGPWMLLAKGPGASLPLLSLIDGWCMRGFYPAQPSTSIHTLFQFPQPVLARSYLEVPEMCLLLARLSNHSPAGFILMH